MIAMTMRRLCVVAVCAAVLSFAPAVAGAVPRGLGTVTLVDGTRTEAEVLFEHPNAPLLINRTLDDRPEKALVSTLADERSRIATRLLTVRFVDAQGVTGAWLILRDAKGNAVASRQIASNVAIGCTGPRQAILAARVPGKHTLEVASPTGTAERFRWTWAPSGRGIRC